MWSLCRTRNAYKLFILVGKKGRDSACINGAYGSESKWTELADNSHVVSFLYIAEGILGFIP